VRCFTVSYSGTLYASIEGTVCSRAEAFQTERQRIPEDNQDESAIIMSTTLVYVAAVLLSLVIFFLIHFLIVGAIIRISRIHKPRIHTPAYQIEVEQMGSLYQLGELESRFDQQDLRVVFTIVGLICAPIGFFLILSPWSSDIGGLLIHGWGVIWTSACLLPAIVSLTRRRQHIAVYTSGLIALKGEQRVIARWDQIEKFWKNVQIGRSPDSSDYFEYNIQLTDGTYYRFTDNLDPGVSNLGRRIEQEVTRLLLPQAIASCTGGTEMSWDGLRVSPTLLTVDRDDVHRSVPLDDLEVVTLDEEKLAIFRKSERQAWYKQRVETIANVAVFKGLVDHLLQEHIRSQLPLVIATYGDGTPLVFGRVTLTPHGIDVDQGKKQLPWDELSTVEVTDDQVSIRSRRDILRTWQRLARWMVPNAALLEELVQYRLMQR
jgi:hypothetical protein